MGRKSRLKRERATEGAPGDAAHGPSSSPPPAPVSNLKVEPEPVAQTRRGPRRKPRAMGARVARVAVDDATWTAFRELCGATPASIRLGELVLAEVQRVRHPAPQPEAVAAVAAIRAYVDELEAFVRGAPPRQ